MWQQITQATNHIIRWHTNLRLVNLLITQNKMDFSILYESLRLNFANVTSVHDQSPQLGKQNLFQTHKIWFFTILLNYGHWVMIGMYMIITCFQWSACIILLFCSPLGSSCWNDLFERYLQLQQNQHSKRIGRKNCSDRRSPPLATPYSVSVRIQWIRISRSLACRLDGMVWCCMVGLCQRWAWMASQ